MDSYTVAKLSATHPGDQADHIMELDEERLAFISHAVGLNQGSG